MTGPRRDQQDPQSCPGHPERAAAPEATGTQRPHDVSELTAAELERARRELAASLALARPGSMTTVPILARISAIDAELARRHGASPQQDHSSPLP
jgi:hypothetical protein